MRTTREPPEMMRFERNLLPTLVESIEERQRLGGSPHRRHSPNRRWAIAVTVLAAGVALALIVPIALPGGPGGADPAAAAMLRRVARRAAIQPPEPVPKPGQYLYTKSTSFQTFMYVVGNGRPNFYFEQTLTRESWIGTDGSGRILETAGPVSFPSTSDRAKWEAAGSPDLRDQQGGDDLYQAGELSYQDYSNVPKDPTALLDAIEERKIVGGPDGDWETFRIVGDLLRETYTVPAVRAALYEVAADLPGVELVGRVTDGIGRPGVAVAYTYDTSRIEWIFDPQTAELLGESEVLVKDSTLDTTNNPPGDIYGGAGHPGTTAYAASFLVRGVTDSVDERP